MSSLYFSDLGPFEMVRRFARRGWGFLELSKDHAHDLVAAGSPPYSGAAIKQFAKSEGVTFIQGHLPVVQYKSEDRRHGTDGWFDNAPAADQAFAKAMEVTEAWLHLFAAMDIKIAVLHMGGAALKEAGWTDAAVFERRLEALARIATCASEVGVTVCLENMSYPNSGVRTADQILAFISTVGADNVGVCLDTGHAVMAGIDCVEFIRVVGSALAALHIHDNLGLEDNHVLPYECNSISWDRVLPALSDSGYAGAFNLEIVSRPWRPMPIREARLDYARAVATHMLGVGITQEAGSRSSSAC